MDQLQKLFYPRSIAIIGISRSTPSLGRMILDNIEHTGFDGSIYLVNPKAKKIADYPVYNEISTIPEAIDLAVILTPPRFVPAIIEEVAEKNCKFLSVITAGFEERLNRELLELCATHGIRIVGPNSMGTYTPSAHVSFSPIPVDAGSFGYISQSGSIIAVVQELMTGRFGFSSFISLGNKIDINESDVLPYLIEQQETKVVGGYLESFSDPVQLRQQLVDAATQKPVILVKGGRTDEGSKAVSSHTGALAGNFRLTRSLMRESGVMLVPTIEKQIALARFVDKYGISDHHGIVTISSAGGPGVLAADEIVEAGLNLAKLQPETIEKLQDVIPPFGNTHNPLDLVADAGIDRYLGTIEVIKDDPNVSTMVVIIVHPVLIDTEPLLAALDSLDLPIICAYLGPAYSSFDHYKNLIVYQTTEEIAWILKQINQYHAWKQSLTARTDQSHLDQVLLSEHNLDHTSIHDLLQTYGFTYPQQMTTDDYQKAKSWFEQLNRSVVLKLDHPQFSHKTDSGGVILDIDTGEEFDRAWQELQQIYADHGIDESQMIEIQEFYSGGIEMVLGIIRDNQFGHFLLIGAGGTMVELVDDTIFLPLPTSAYAVRKALSELKLAKLLEGYRGSHPVDLDTLTETILQLDLLVSNYPEIEELDINPLYILPETDQYVVLDARYSTRNSQPKTVEHH